MKVTLTCAEMVARRRLALGLASERADCTIERTDGVLVDDALAKELRRWYLDLLDHAPRSSLAPENIAAEVTVAALPDTMGALITLPADCRRVFELKMPGWLHAVSVLPPEALPAALSRQHNPYTAATTARPLAVAQPGADGGVPNAIMAWPVGLQATPLVLNAVVDPGPDYFTLDDSAL